MKKTIIILLMLISFVNAGWFMDEYWVIASESLNSPTIVYMKTENKQNAVNYAVSLKNSGKYGAVNVGLAPCRLEGGFYGIYVCKDIVFRYVNW